MNNPNNMIFSLMREYATSPSIQQAKSNETLIDFLQEKICDVLDELIPQSANVVLLDYPNNPNVGDSLIWLGEIAYLKYRKIKIKYVCDVKNYNRMLLENILDSNTIILMHGGGNFGTIWPEEQRFREKVLLDFPNTCCIQLPQSISFDNPEAIKKAAKAINSHSNLTILVRDKASFEFASREFNSKVRMCPDMAFFIGAINTPVAASIDCLVLSRTDHEKANGWVYEIGSKLSDLNFEITDWLDASLMERLLHRIKLHTVGLRRLVDKDNLFLMLLWNCLAKLRMRRGISILQQGSVVLTDRLHAHILSVLMNKPHIVIDNANKKISGYYKTWTIGYPKIRLIETVDDAYAAFNEVSNPIVSKGSHHFNKTRENSSKSIRSIS